MSIGLLGRKVAMTQIYDFAGNVIPVTVIQAGPCHVLQLKTMTRDGYEAVQLGFLDKPRRLASRAQRGHVAKLDSKRQKSRGTAGLEAVPKAGGEPKRFIREFRASTDAVAVGDQVQVDIFRPALEELPGLLEELAGKHSINTAEIGWEGKLRAKAADEYRAVVASIRSVDVVGTSKGRGTTGAMKRHNFSGQRASHGVKKCHRHVGGIGCSADPSRTVRGKKMAGQYGNARSTVRNLQVVRIDLDNNLLLVRGAVPGPNGGFVVVRHTNKLPGPLPLQAAEAK